MLVKWSEKKNFYDFYVESIAFRIKVLINFNLVINDTYLYNNIMRIGKYLDQTGN